MSASDFDASLTCLQKIPDHRRREVLAVVGNLLRHDAAIFTWRELLRFAEREQISGMELRASVEYCWLCGWCGYDPQSGMVGGGAMEAFRTEGQEQDKLHNGGLGNDK